MRAIRIALALALLLPSSGYAQPLNDSGVYRCIKRGEYAAAEQAFQAVTEANPGDGSAWQNLGVALAAQRKFPEAIAAFERAIPLLKGTDLGLVYYNLANVSLKHGQAGTFQRYYDELQRVLPDFRPTVMVVAQAEAMAALSTLPADQPAGQLMTSLNSLLSDVYDSRYISKRPEEPFYESYALGQDAPPLLYLHRSPTGQLALALWHTDHGDDESAEAALRAALDGLPPDALEFAVDRTAASRAHMLRGQLYLGRQDTEQAIREIEQALKINREPDAYATLGLAYWMSGNKSNAQWACRQAIALTQQIQAAKDTDILQIQFQPSSLVQQCEQLSAT